MAATLQIHTFPWDTKGASLFCNSTRLGCALCCHGSSGTSKSPLVTRPRRHIIGGLFGITLLFVLGMIRSMFFFLCLPYPYILVNLIGGLLLVVHKPFCFYLTLRCFAFVVASFQSFLRSNTSVVSSESSGWKVYPSSWNSLAPSSEPTRFSAK